VIDFHTIIGNVALHYRHTSFSQELNMTRLSKAALQRAVNHLIRYGDTDVLPHPIEAVFLYEKKASIVEELSKLDLDSFNPTQALEAIARGVGWIDR
jgi:hypothetical protein